MKRPTPRLMWWVGVGRSGLGPGLTLHPATDFGLPVHDAVDQERARPELLGLGYPVISMDPADVPSSGPYRNLLRGFEGPELQHLQMYLSGEKNVTANTPRSFCSRTWMTLVSALRTACYLWRH